MSFSYEKSVADKTLTLTFNEVIDENFDVSLKELAGYQTLRIELSKVNCLNSEGTRQLTKWFWEVRNLYPSMAIILSNLPPLVARQFIAVGKFIPEDIEIASVQVPFYCENCDEEDRSTIVHATAVRAAPSLKEFAPPPVTCKTCKAKMDLDVIPEKYFALLAKR